MPAPEPIPTPVLQEQQAYYRAVAPAYEDYAIAGAWGGEIVAALDAFAPTGDVLELACGPGSWTSQLLRYASRFTAVDGSPEMLSRAEALAAGHDARFIHADIFSWRPDRAYDVVFFGFWLSHVPEERFEAFWQLVADALTPGGRVFFVDDALRTPDELVYGESSPLVRRRLHDGSEFTVVKVPYEPAALESRLRGLGWQITVRPASPPFFWGEGARST
jgi:SAM-dependent methyltransferase